MVIIGIDPGKTGGVALMNERRNCHTFPLPMVDNKVDVGALQEIILEYFSGRSTATDSTIWKAYLERQQLRSGNRGNMVIGENYGRITAVLDLLRIPTKEVSPHLWKKTLFPGQKTKGNKEISIKKCLEEGYQLPTLRPRGKILHDGIADAICIALYGWNDQGPS